MGIAEITGWYHLDAFPVLEKMLLNAGFANVKLEKKPFHPDGSQFMFTVTAEKCESKTIREILTSLFQRVKAFI